MIGRFIAYSAIGWAYEAIVRGPHWSLVWGRRKIPLLPVYGVGGLLAEVMADRLRDRPAAERALAYAAGLSAYEFASCKVSEAVYGERDWDYNGKCVDFPHAAAWGAAGMALEQVDIS